MLLFIGKWLPGLTSYLSLLCECYGFGLRQLSHKLSNVYLAIINLVYVWVKYVEI